MRLATESVRKENRNTNVEKGGPTAGINGGNVSAKSIHHWNQQRQGGVFPYRGFERDSSSTVERTPFFG